MWDWQLSALYWKEGIGNHVCKNCRVFCILFFLLVLLFTIVFFILGLTMKNMLGLNDFWTAFWFFLGLAEGLGLFDLVIIDLLWWRNTKRIRFSFLPEKGLYQNPDKHIGSFLHGIPLFAAVAVLTAYLVVLL